MTVARRTILITLTTLVIACGSGGCGAPQKALTGGDGSAEVNLYASADSSGALQRVIDSCNASSGNSYSIRLNALGAELDQRTQITRRLSAKDPSVDLIAVPVTWMPEFVAAGWAQPLTGGTKSAISRDSLAGPLSTATSKKRLYGAPFTTEVDVLWYRSDLTPQAPRTWNDVLAESQRLEAARHAHDVDVMSRDASVTTAWFDALTTSFGGSLLDTDSKQATPDNSTRSAAEILRSFAAAGVLKAEGVASLSQNAAFAIAPTSVFGASTIPGTVSWSPYPRVATDRAARPPLGGTNLVVSSSSNNQRQAVKAMQCLRNRDSQRLLATAAKDLPTTSDLYEDEAVRTAIPRIGELKPSITDGTPPLRTPLSDRVASAVQTALSPLESIDPDTVNQKLETEINTALDYRSIQG